MKIKNFVAFPTVHWSHNWERQHELIFRTSEWFEKTYVHQPYGLINYGIKELLEKIQEYSSNKRKSAPSILTNPVGKNFEFVNHIFVPFHYIQAIDRLNYKILSKKAAPAEGSVVYAGYCNAFMLHYFRKGGFRWLDLFARRQVSEQLSSKAKAIECEAVETADLITADSRTTIEDYADIRPDIVYLPQGVDVGRFYPADGLEYIALQAARYRGVVGYMGTDLVVDVALMEGVIKKCSDVLFVLIGDFSRGGLSGLKKYPNVYFTGRLGYFELNKALNSIDVGLIPYLINQRTSGVFPTKYYEYLACNKPVVTTPLTDLVDKVSGHVLVAEGVKGFVEAIYELLEKNYEQKAPLLEAMENTWTMRLEVIKRELLKKI
ncbi:glycosyltransferase [Thermaurantimonas aggregans]|uniref:glycosyltransferase n=1 Tax=Thermaurantimonas aggregans TaxID=2173829 RepID=UPI0023EFFE99|nr:glycosyltransferase [Thermaurantimonas aggregans]MCX8149469.1 glycosyltransferase [Thermaurantimonas aggregans]